VLARIGPIAYILALPPKCRNHDVFYEVFLKKLTCTPPVVVPNLPPIKHGWVLPQPEKVLRARLNRDVWEFLMQWMGQAAADATRKNVPEFNDAYPSFQLKDKLFLNGRGEGKSCGHIYLEDVRAPAQASEGPTGDKRRKERQPMKKESVALQF
jgi:hypothetical protein